MGLLTENNRAVAQKGFLSLFLFLSRVSVNSENQQQSIYLRFNLDQGSPNCSLKLASVVISS